MCEWLNAIGRNLVRWGRKWAHSRARQPSSREEALASGLPSLWHWPKKELRFISWAAERNSSKQLLRKHTGWGLRQPAIALIFPSQTNNPIWCDGSGRIALN